MIPQAIIDRASQHRPKLMHFGAGRGRLPQSWPAIITGSVPYYTRTCCESRWRVVNLYSWEAMWDNRDSRVPYTMPAYHEGEGGCWVPDEWPERYEVELDWFFGPKVTGLWAVNTCEFDYSFELNRWLYTGQSQVLLGTQVGMSFGYINDFGTCAPELRPLRLMPFFEFYRSHPLEECFPC